MTYFFSLLIMILPLISYSDGLDVDPIASSCYPTASVTNNKAGEMPKKFRSLNDLTRDAGSFVSTQGEDIIIIGRIMDANCVPIAGASVKIWQDEANTNGTATSDNMGRFHFITHLPKSYLLSLNASINYSKKDNKKNTDEWTTGENDYNYLFIFGNNPQNAKNATNGLSESEINSILMPMSIIEGKKYYFLDVVLNYKQAFKSF